MTGAAMHAGPLYRIEDYVKPEAAVKQLGRKQAVAVPENRQLPHSRNAWLQTKEAK